jgi:hypothetical protein
MGRNLNVRYRALLVAVLSVVVLIGAGSIGAALPAAPHAILSSDRLTAITQGKAYVAWRIDMPTEGFLAVDLLGVQTGSGLMFTAANGSGFGGGSSATNAGTHGVGAHEDPHVDGGGGGMLLPSGVHVVVLIMGSGTVPVGLDVVRLTPPPDATVINVTSGPAFDLAASNFTSDGSTVVSTPLVAAGQVRGSVRKDIQHSLFGFFVSYRPTLTASFVDPGGTTTVVPQFGWRWLGAEPGTYTLRLDGKVPASLNPQSVMQALFADVRIP